MRFASALSTDPSARVALERCSATLLDRLDGPPDLAFLFASAQHAPAFDGLGALAIEATGARHLAGCSAGAVVGTGREVEDRPGLSVLGIRAPGLEVRSVALEARRTDEGFDVTPGLPLGPGDGLVLLGDPYTFPTQPWLQSVADELEGVDVAGGMASGGSGPGQHALWLDDRTCSHGALAIALGGDVRLHTAVSQGCRPVGEPLVVTAAQGNAVQKLRGQPAARVLFQVLEGLEERDRELFRRGPHVGLAIDATKSHFQAQDLLARNIVGLLPRNDAIAIGDDSVRVGMTIQFMLRDAASASDELTRILRERAAEWGRPDAAGALLFTCGGRGAHMFRALSHDARAIEAELGPELPLAGFFANGEIGPVGGRPFLHGFTASVAWLAPRTPTV